MQQKNNRSAENETKQRRDLDGFEIIDFYPPKT